MEISGKMKIIVVGTRGIPGISGGVETHCEELYPRLVEHFSCDVTITTRRQYIISNKSSFNGVKLKPLYAPYNSKTEAIIHTILGVFYAWRQKPDILHIHAIGPSLVTPLARMMGMKVVMTHHGPDYNRAKWGKLAKIVLRFGEKMGARYAHHIIVISQLIADIIAEKYGRTDTTLIYNGVAIPEKTASTGYLSSLGLQPGKYMIGVGRFVEEKGFHDLIDAHSKLEDKSMQLVLVGDADHETTYSQNLKKKARNNGVVLTGYIKGKPLQEIFSHARLFVIPSYHEGLPITLLEALAYGLDILASDIPANRELGLHKEDYFATGDIDQLASALKHKLQQGKPHDYSSLLKKYNWDAISDQTWEVYKKAASLP